MRKKTKALLVECIHSIAPRIDGAFEVDYLAYVDANELGLAFDLLLQNAYPYSTELTTQEYQMIEKCAASMRIKEKDGRFIRELVQG